MFEAQVAATIKPGKLLTNLFWAVPKEHHPNNIRGGQAFSFYW